MWPDCQKARKTNEKKEKYKSCQNGFIHARERGNDEHWTIYFFSLLAQLNLT